MDRLNPELLKKLQAISLKEEGSRAVGQLNEAEVAAGLLSKLLAKHHLTIEDVKIYAAKLNRPQPTRRIFHPNDFECTHHKVSMTWQNQLAMIVAEAFFCETIAYTGSNMREFIGFEEDLEVALTVFAYLCRTLEVAQDKGYRKEYNRLRNRHKGEEKALDGWRPAFMMGAIARLNYRFKELRSEAVKEANMDQSTALAIFNARAIEVSSKMEELHPDAFKSKGKLRQSENMIGWLQGIEFASGIPLSDGLKPGSPVKPKLLN